MHLKPHDFAAVHVEDHVQIKPVSHYLGRQVRHVPTPQLPRAAGHMSTRWPRALWCSRSTPVANLSIRSQHTAEAGFAGDIDSFVGQHRYDTRRWQLRKSRLVGDPQNPLPLVSTQSMSRCTSYGLRTLIPTLQAIALPALQSANVDPGQLAGGLQS